MTARDGQLCMQCGYKRLPDGGCRCEANRKAKRQMGAASAADGLEKLLRGLPSRNLRDVQAHVSLVRQVVKALHELAPAASALYACCRIADALDAHVAANCNVPAVHAMTEVARRLRAGESIE